MSGDDGTFEGTVLLEMVGELHRRGYELIRVMPFMAPSGMHWRLAIRAAGSTEVARYTSATGAEFFRWPETGLGSAELAGLFVQRFPALAAAGLGKDPEYAGWYRSMLELARRGWIPYFYADWDEPDNGLVPLASVEPTDEPRPELPDPPGGR